MPRPRTPAFVRRKILGELRQINEIMRYVVGQWSTLASMIREDDGQWRKREPHEMPENNVDALDDLVKQLDRVIEWASAIQAYAGRRIAFLEIRAAKKNQRTEEADRG